MNSFKDKTGKVGLRQLRTSLKWRFPEPDEDSRLGISTMKADYDCGLDDCVAATRQALRNLEFVIVGGELHPTEARIDARSEMAELVFIHIKSTDEAGRTQVFFHAGRDWSPDGTELIRKLRDEFERCLNDPERDSP
jgi:hypothetical protein